MVITNALILDWWGIVMDVGLDGRIVASAKPATPRHRKG